MFAMSRWAFALAALLGGSLVAGEPASAQQGVPTAVKTARTTKPMPCTVFVDVAARSGGDGSLARPLRSIAKAVGGALPGAVICVAEGVYTNQIYTDKPFTLAGGFKSGSGFTVRDSAVFVSRAQGNGQNSFVHIEDLGPSGDELTAIDGFEITGYSQAVYRDVYYSQRFELTNNYIHDNVCSDSTPGAGAGFWLNNVSGVVAKNVFARNKCGRGGAGAVNDSANENTLSIENNRFVENSGTEPVIAHGGALYLFANKLKIIGNVFAENSATGWGGGLYLGAFTGGGQFTNAKLRWNRYHGNRAGIRGGGLFCDDSATCLSEHEIYDGNCGGNIYLDGGPDGSGPTVARFDHLTNYGALDVGCTEPGAGVVITKNNDAPDSYSFKNAIFFRNAKRRDFDAFCDGGCGALQVSIDYSMVRRNNSSTGVAISYGPGIVTPENPLFVAPGKGDFHLKSTNGHWKKSGYVADDADSPALAKGDPASPTDDSPARAGDRVELGAYGNSPQASYVE